MNKRAFTLIELLIVVAIIGILAAIAVPNFLNAQIRAKVSRMQADHRSLHTAMMMYRVDNNSFHQHSHAPNQNAPLTTPTAYMATSPADAFGMNAVDKQGDQYYGGSIHWEPIAAYGDQANQQRLISIYPGLAGWLGSTGPSTSIGGEGAWTTKYHWTYASSNGLVSPGILQTWVPGQPYGDYKFR